MDKGLSKELLPRKKGERQMGVWGYMSLWLADGVNMGNITLGGSLVVAGSAVMNFYQTMTAAFTAIAVISLVFVLNDKLGYRMGIPYVMQLALSFGEKGAEYAGLLRGIPALVWYGFQTFIGATALNEIFKMLMGFDGLPVAFASLLTLETLLSLGGFHVIKWIESGISLAMIAAFLFIFCLLLTEHNEAIYTGLFLPEGTWGLPFWGFTLAFMGNYAALFLSAADYSRELKLGLTGGKRWLLYFCPILLAYGMSLSLGAMLSVVTGIANPAHAVVQLLGEGRLTLCISLFIVLSVIAVNMVANVVAPTYIISRIARLSYKKSVLAAGLLSVCTCPWLLVSDESALGLTYFILAYSAFLGPVLGILLVEYYLLRRQTVDIDTLYKNAGDTNKNAFLAMFVGAAAAFIQVELAWLIGLAVGSCAYYFFCKGRSQL